MLSKRLQILITLIFVTMMFVQTPAMASNYSTTFNIGSNTNSNDYQSVSQNSGKTASTNDNYNVNNLNTPAKTNSVNAVPVTINQTKATILMNSSYVNPGQYMNLTINSSSISNFNFNNNFTYAINDPLNKPIYGNSTGTLLTNNTVNSTNLASSWTPSLNGQLSYNSSSVSQIYAVQVNSSTITNTSYSLTTEKVDWKTLGNTTSEIKYGQTSTLTSPIDMKIGEFSNTHEMFLTNLELNKTYYYQIFGVDYFGRTINSSIYSFKTSIGTGYPYITGNSLTLSYTNESLTLSYSTNIAIDYQYTIARTRSGLSTAVPQPYNTPITSGLNPGTQYYFKILLMNPSNHNLNTTYDNGGKFYTFVTLQNSVGVSITQIPTLTTSLVFTTDVLTNASIIYSSDPNFINNVRTTPFDNLNTTHTFNLTLEGANQYFYKINITDGSNYYLINNQNKVKSVIATTAATLSTYFPSYFSVKTDPTAKQDINVAKFEFIFEIPKYPAILGMWQLALTINQNLKSSVSYPASIKKTSFTIAVQFKVNDTLMFHVDKILVQRGTNTNSSGTFPIWLANTKSIFSPTDNITYIGYMAYSSSPSTKLNTTDWTQLLPGYTTSGIINLYFNNSEVYPGSKNIYSINSQPWGIDSSFFSGYNSSIEKVMNFQIPAIDIYGNLTVDFGLKMPQSNTWNTTQYYQTQILTNLNVKYRLMVTNSTAKPSYSLTTTDFVQSATVLPYHYYNLTTAYPGGNESSILSIPGRAINITVSVVWNNISQHIFEVVKQNYTIYWLRKTLESTLNQGSYTVKLIWTGFDGKKRDIVSQKNTVYDQTPKEFSYTFSLTVSFAIKDMTANLTVLRSANITLQFKIIVPFTGIAWDQNLNATVDTTNGVQTCHFDPVTGQYSFNIISSSQLGQHNVTVTYDNGKTGMISYIVVSQIPISVSSGANKVNTVVTHIKKISFTNYGLIGFAVLSTIGYAVFIILTTRRK